MSINITVKPGPGPDNQISGVEYRDNTVNILCPKGTVTITASCGLCLTSIVNLSDERSELSDDEFPYDELFELEDDEEDLYDEFEPAPECEEEEPDREEDAYPDEE